MTDAAPDAVARDAARAAFPTRAEFAAAIGEPFDLAVGEAMARLTLVEATSSAPATSASFSLIFREPAQRVLPQGIRRLRNATLGTLDIFLVPVARDGQGTSYQAIFN